MLSIGEMARRTGVKVPTIRYYEQMGLLAAPERSEGGQRRYTKREAERLGFIRHARDLGLGIDDIRELLTLGEDPEQPCGEVDAIARRHLQAVQEKIARLQGLERELSRIIEACDCGTVGDCAVLQALGDHGLCEGEH